MVSEIGNPATFNVNMPNQVLNKNNEQKSPDEDFEKKAQSMGVPDDIIKQGKQAVKAWVMESRQNANSSDNPTENQKIIPKEGNKSSDSRIDLFA